MALALKKYTLIPTDEGTLDPLYPDGNTPPSAPVLGSVTVVSAIELDIPLLTPSSGGVAPLNYVLERSQTSASAGFTTVTQNVFSPVEDVYEDTGLTPETQYWYRALAVDSNSTPRQSDYSNVVTGTTDEASGDVTPPSVPVWSGSPSTTTTTITLTWLAATDS